MTTEIPNDEEQRKQLLAVSTAVLSQAIDLVEKRLTSDDQLLVHAKHLPGSTIGKHLRHARDHFEALLDSASVDSPKFSYDVRKRDLPMESNLLASAEALKATVQRLENIVPHVSVSKPVTLDAVTPYQQTVGSTFGRELWFCGLHTIHHWAMVRVISGEMGVELDDSFGFAPSTLVNQGSTDAPLGKAKI